MTMHPYQMIPRYSRWKQGVADGVEVRELIAGLNFRGLNRSDRVFSAGSCFASNIVPYLERSRITYIRTERRHRALTVFPDGLGYEICSSSYRHNYQTM